MIYVFRNEYKTAVPAGEMKSFWVLSPRGSKGKQVRILYDPVTVFGEFTAILSLTKVGKAAAERRSMSQETCRRLTRRF